MGSWSDPPAGHPLVLLHVCHSCFVVRSAGGTTLLIDPYFGGDFRWKGHPERHAGPPPAIRSTDLARCDGVLLTHEHPDHCEPTALRDLAARTRCGVWGPAGVYRNAVEAGIDTNLVTKLEMFQKFTVGDIEITALPNRGSEDAKPCMRMSYVFKCGGQSVFHGGDSHGPTLSWSGHADGPTLALLWPVHIDKVVNFLKPKSLALMHCDRFEPGEFLCNYDAAALGKELAARFKAVNVLAPVPGEWFWPSPLSVEELRRRSDKPQRRERAPRPPGAPEAGTAAPAAPAAPAPEPETRNQEPETNPPAPTEAPSVPAAPAPEPETLPAEAGSSPPASPEPETRNQEPETTSPPPELN
jgi:L-ascorbate metabolism protein UlaG (beta-lactamase superfamily)